MKPTRTLTFTAVAYVGVLAVYAIAPHFMWMRIDALYNFELGALVVGLAATLATLADRIRLNRRLARMTVPLTEQMQQDFESLVPDPCVLG